MDRQEALLRIENERNRQELLKEQGKFDHTLSDIIPWADKYTILGEEFGEIARAIQNRDFDNLKDELTQVAALCLAWLETP